MKVGQHVSFMSVEEAWVTNKHNRWTTPAEVTCFCLRHVLMLLRWCRVYGSCVVFNKKLIDFCVTRTFLNQKLWVDKSICTALRTNTTACNKKLSVSNMRKYKAASDKVHRVQSVSRRARTITDCEEKPSSSLAGEAQIFYAYCEGRKPTYHLVGWDRSQLKEDLIPLKAGNLLDVSSREGPTSTVIYSTTASSPHASNSQT